MVGARGRKVSPFKCVDRLDTPAMSLAIMWDLPLLLKTNLNAHALKLPLYPTPVMEVLREIMRANST